MGPTVQRALVFASIGEVMKSCDIALESTPANSHNALAYLNCMAVFEALPDGGSGWCYSEYCSTPHLDIRR